MFNKTALVIVSANAICLLLAIGVFGIYDYLTFTYRLLHTLSFEAQIIGSAASPPLMDGRSKDAESWLLPLKADPAIRVGGIYSAVGMPVAIYKNANLTPPPAKLPPGVDSEEHWFRNSRLHFVAPIIFGGKQIGYVYLRAAVDRLQQRLLVCAGLCVFVFAVLILTLWRMWRVFTKEVVLPVIDLSGTMRAILETKDYSIRAPAHRHWGELWLLRETLNELLSHIQLDLAESNPKRTNGADQ